MKYLESWILPWKSWSNGWFGAIIGWEAQFNLSTQYIYSLSLSLFLGFKVSLHLSVALCFFQAMEANNSTDAHNYSRGSQTQTHKDNGTSLPSSYVFIAVIVTSFILLTVLSLIIILLLRLKSSKKRSDQKGNGNSIKGSSSDFTGPRHLNYNSSPGKLN